MSCTDCSWQPLGTGVRGGFAPWSLKRADAVSSSSPVLRAARVPGSRAAVSAQAPRAPSPGCVGGSVFLLISSLLLRTACDTDGNTG